MKLTSVASKILNIFPKVVYDDLFDEEETVDPEEASDYLSANFDKQVLSRLTEYQESAYRYMIEGIHRWEKKLKESDLDDEIKERIYKDILDRKRDLDTLKLPHRVVKLNEKKLTPELVKGFRLNCFEICPDILKPAKAGLIERLVVSRCLLRNSVITAAREDPEINKLVCYWLQKCEKIRDFVNS